MRYIVTVRYVVEQKGKRASLLNQVPQEAADWGDAQAAVVAELREEHGRALRHITSISTAESPRA